MVNVLTMKGSNFCNVMPSSMVEIYQHIYQTTWCHIQTTVVLIKKKKHASRVKTAQSLKWSWAGQLRFQSPSRERVSLFYIAPRLLFTQECEANQSSPSSAGVNIFSYTLHLCSSIYHHSMVLKYRSNLTLLYLTSLYVTVFLKKVVL
jgi:hypothetical protein